MLLKMGKAIRGVSFTTRIATECSSIALGIGAYAVFFLPGTFHLVGASSLMQRRSLGKFFLLASTVILAIHFGVHLTISARHRQTQELMLFLFRILADGIMFFCGCAIVLGPVCRIFQCFWSSKHHRQSDTLRVCTLPFWRVRVVVGIFLTFMLLILIVPLFLPGDGKRLLEVGMLGDRVDFCGLEGLKLSRAAAVGWVIPEYTHRRLLNAFGGSDQCGTNRILFLDDEEEVLIVSPLCPDGSRQVRVYVEFPERSELNGGTEVLPKVVNISKKWHQTLEKRYGMNETVHQSMGVHVTRGPTGVIQSVEIIPSRLVPVLRKPRTEHERIARAGWPSNEVWVIPLGESGAYTAYCSASDHEEYQIFPPVRHSTRLQGEAGEKKGQEEAHPPASVLLLVLDAVSRQEVRRSLPKFSNWLRNFRSNRSSKHVFVEAQGATTISHSTEANLVPLFTGNIVSRLRGIRRGVAEASLFRLAKRKYGSRLSTSYTVGDCMDMMSSLFGERDDNAGFGEPYGNDLDYYTFGPFCHIQYSALEGNFQGPNSIFRRCIGQQYVHEYVLNYTRALVRRRLRQRRREEEKKKTKRMNPLQNDSLPLHDDAVFFFDVLHLLEGHEGTHGVLYLVDDALVAFLDELQNSVGFFDDPSNALLLLSDHGNHMGPYYELTAPGKLERALPFVSMILHHELLSRMDRIKGYAAGVTLSNLMQRTRRISTTLDLHMTLADLLGVEAKIPKSLEGLGVLPSSLFNARDVPRGIERCSDLGALNSKGSGCYLMWCDRK
ncbi:putative transmembrane protein [Trypanosoma rangeli]|uniref:Putative transmembrane protein n=1 Tax=Trypanosoma rangeli TaxID=5698 RepID=A0A422NP69_TRYRA|nr:putative transmembrane protein [Trypanosoma rangeli]RNF07272.1 putative transmembrane protein [Trypanosoma rangeli]|eukprot:RNF07272.1 putative transmembrane protein [Trypanosoma rangeli]